MANDLPLSDDAEVALENAAFNRKLQLVRDLLVQGVDVNQADEANCTALHYACEFRQPEMVRLLLEYGADVNIRDVWGEDAFYMAGDNGELDIMEMLWRAGVDKERYPYYKEKWG